MDMSQDINIYLFMFWYLVFIDFDDLFVIVKFLLLGMLDFVFIIIY